MRNWEEFTPYDVAEFLNSIDLEVLLHHVDERLLERGWSDDEDLSRIVEGVRTTCTRFLEACKE